MTKTSKRVVEIDPKTGKPIEADSSAPCISFFDDDQGENLYSSTVLLEGKKIWVRELTLSERDEYNRMDEAARQHLRNVADEEDAIKAAAETQAWQDETVAAQQWVVDRCIIDWELTRPDGAKVPCTLETKQKLRPAHRAYLSDCMVAKSNIGKDVVGFLSAS